MYWDNKTEEQLLTLLTRKKRRWNVTFFSRFILCKVNNCTMNIDCTPVCSAVSYSVTTTAKRPVYLHWSIWFFCFFPPLFHLFLSFQTQITISQQINVKKCLSSKWCRDTNSQPLEHESPPTTPRLMHLFAMTRLFCIVGFIQLCHLLANSQFHLLNKICCPH